MAQTHQEQAVACPHCGQAVAIEALAGDAAAAELDPVAAAGPPRAADRDPPPSSIAGSPRPGPADWNAPAAGIPGGELGEGVGEPNEVRSRTRQERAAYRRRVNLLVFAISAAILAVAVACLLLWSG